MNKENILILGAGTAGMACAMELTNAAKTSTIIEKNGKVGGLAKTLKFKEGKYLFKTDNGPHRFFSKNKYLYDFIENLLHEKWKPVRRQTRQYIDEKFYDYPINAKQAFKNIGIIRATGMVASYFHAVLKYKFLRRKIKNFDDHIVSNFGRKLGEFNMLNYTEKIWGIDCKQIHPDWAQQRIQGLSLISALKDTISKKKDRKEGPKTLIDTFYYPQYGTGLIYETIAEKIGNRGSRIKTDSFPTKIMHDCHKIFKVELSINGKRETMSPSHLITSIPITELIRLLAPAPPFDIIKATENLKWRSQVYLFITLDKKRITNDNWIYFPDKQIPFGRISEMINFSEHMSPKNKTSLFVEFFVTEEDEIWKMSKQELFNLSMRYFDKLKLFSREEIRNYYVYKEKYVYPVYDLNYKYDLQIIKNYLDDFENLYYIGRLGRFQYTNQDHSLEMGILTAKCIIQDTKFNLDKIGSDKEYFEKGFLMNEQNSIKNQSF